MKFKEFQAFIPGWNIVYMIRENRAAEKACTVAIGQLKQHTSLLNNYATLREEAKARGDVETVSYLNDKLQQLVEYYGISFREK